MITRRQASHAVAAMVLAIAVLAIGSGAVAAPSTPPSTAAAAGSNAAPRSAGPGQAPVVLSARHASSWTAGGLINVDPGSFSAQQLSSGATAASSGGFARVGACTFYATSASAGGYCGGGYGGSHPPSLQAWLAGRPFIPCRYFDVPAGMIINAGSAPGGRWMLKACFENVDPTQPWGGRDMIVDVLGEWVPDGKDITIPPYMEDFWAHESQENFYPVPRISIGPTQPALVDTYTYFWATWVTAQDSTQPAKEDYRIAYNTLTQGTVYLHMQVHDVVVHPGTPAMDPVHCGLAKVEFNPNAPDAIPQSKGGSQQSDCWLMYEHSTAFHSDTQTLMIHADAYWHVTIETADGHVVRDLGDFHYAAFQRLAIAEVQTLVNW